MNNKTFDIEITYHTPQGDFDSIAEGSLMNELSEYEFLMKCRKEVDGYSQTCNKQPLSNINYYSDVIGSNTISHSSLIGSHMISSTEKISLSNKDVIEQFKKDLDI